MFLADLTIFFYYTTALKIVIKFKMIITWKLLGEKKSVSVKTQNNYNYAGTCSNTH